MIQSKSLKPDFWEERCSSFSECLFCHSKVSICKNAAYSQLQLQLIKVKLWKK